MSSISFHTDTTTSISHNNRINIFGNKDIDLDKLERNIYYIQKDIREIYKNEFDEVVREYNSKQKRNDRKINDYYKKILNDKKTEHQRELIVAIGSKDENTTDEIVGLKKNILDKYMKTFQGRNPNLKVYNAVMHLDEANPHLHINYVPVAHYGKGLRKRVSYEKALKEQGSSFEEWRKKETDLIEDLMSQEGFERDFIGSHKHMSVKEYKDLKKEIHSLKNTKEMLKEAIKESQSTLKKIKTYSKYMSNGNLQGTKVEIVECDYEGFKGGIYYIKPFYKLACDIHDFALSENRYYGKNNIYNFKINVFDDTTCGDKIDLISNFKFKVGLDKYFSTDSLEKELLQTLNPLMKNHLEKLNNISLEI